VGVPVDRSALYRAGGYHGNLCTITGVTFEGEQPSMSDRAMTETLQAASPVASQCV